MTNVAAQRGRARGCGDLNIFSDRATQIKQSTFTLCFETSRAWSS